jgi:hypothetical protein
LVATAYSPPSRAGVVGVVVVDVLHSPSSYVFHWCWRSLSVSDTGAFGGATVTSTSAASRLLLLLLLLPADENRSDNAPFSLARSTAHVVTDSNARITNDLTARFHHNASRWNRLKSHPS